MPMAPPRNGDHEVDAMDVDATDEVGGYEQTASEPHPLEQPRTTIHESADRRSGQWDIGRPGRILFYHRGQPYYEFTNFSPHEVVFEGRTYPTAEHLFQAHKFLPIYPQLAERIRELPSSRAALQEATRLSEYRRKDWFDVNITVMDTVLEAKFMRHSYLRRMLLSTGDSVLIENSPIDAFWGVAQDGKGRNELGKALMRLRDKLKHPGETPFMQPFCDYQ
ncbi:hypothetical protein POSPLADRAFT_1039630 [Postia placenta MAD-698-R-SB12]|uniref:NADAR domain-containing protein n=1 Tax=Postia placenta MAD-698-R-SB12 TaxID=670580 RepID=A0A1X6N578_9APHY|nr:hypothetical protein POSPLADRAFT_1039630 [Postia placenta MAD-698-R-SB12]OSX63771.1 hypothetical protein POSPLADRAFT_1039630 [Postia placenta MAD-698-R-SB12]